MLADPCGKWRALPSFAIVCREGLGLFHPQIQVVTAGNQNCTPKYLNPPEPTFCRVPINSILGFIIRTDKKVGFGRLR